MTSQPRCYALRSLNPFSGILQVIELPEARAFTRTGREWEIEIQLEAINSLWSSPQTTSGTRQFYRYARWTKCNGLQQTRINPAFNISAMSEAGQGMSAALEQLHDAIPFPLSDHYEYWLLEQAHLQPLVLIASQIQSPTGVPTNLNTWCASPLQQRTFPTHLAEEVLKGLSPSDLLESLVKAQHGSPRMGQWFLRQEDGSGIGMQGRIASALTNRKLPCSAFPPLLIQEEWPDASSNQLVQDYLCHLAPWLLALPDLARQRREELEHCASRQPQLMSRLYRLYPEVTDPQLLTATRVQARLADALHEATSGH